MKLCFNTETLFQQQSIYESMRRLSGSGLRHIEFWSWHDKDLDELKRLKEELGMEVVSVVVTPESFVDPARREKMLAAVRGSANAAGFLGARRMVATVGTRVEGLSRKQMQDSLVEGLKACIPILEEHDVMIAIEPLNTKVDKELENYYLDTSDEAFEIVSQIGHPLIKVCYDIYHVQIMEGHIISRMQNNIRHIGHIQAAGNPGRHELYIGEIHYDNVFDAVKQLDYDGYIGIEYFPLHDPIADLVHLHNKFHTERKPEK
jgi:hydroxypyruvate isomerase